MPFDDNLSPMSERSVGLTVVILTYNEEIHIGRAIASVQKIAERIFVIDSGSSDRTVEIAQAQKAEVLVHPFTTQAKQFNWALAQLPDDTDWVLRLDADEVVTAELAREISTNLASLAPEVSGVELSRRIAFLRRPIRHGGVFPVRLIRLFRFGRGHSEDRWMDEHIVVDGPVARLHSEILDDNLKPLGWWIDKHNAYAAREVVELLDAEFHMLIRSEPQRLHLSQASAKRWLKDRVYARLPGGFRALAYFFYRYVIRLGFLDGREGTAFHVLQGFWYRFLVDAKLHEVHSYMARTGTDAPTAIREVLGIDVTT